MNQIKMEEKNNGFKEYVFDKAVSRFEVITDEIQNRLNLEIVEIIKKQMENIFIMYAKIIEKCNEKEIMHGPGRGASAGSLVAYVLGITKINPLEFGKKSIRKRKWNYFHTKSTGILQRNHKKNVLYTFKSKRIRTEFFRFFQCSSGKSGTDF